MDHRYTRFVQTSNASEGVSSTHVLTIGLKFLKFCTILINEISKATQSHSPDSTSAAHKHTPPSKSQSPLVVHISTIDLHGSEIALTMQPLTKDTYTENIYKTQSLLFAAGLSSLYHSEDYPTKHGSTMQTLASFNGCRSQFIKLVMVM